ncbi:hypothetical protein G7Y89_g4243 [Cudoniella acicularis]|uniref:C2H2-type domain-containing protein n=1 Tax=Cudoniella acicularis TaxID=354080 RepID=A0A8H4RPV5_9HELO|nr:hypothetical protein G7Y89_g4243 [Cudoniella acicularis]
MAISVRPPLCAFNRIFVETFDWVEADTHMMKSGFWYHDVEHVFFNILVFGNVRLLYSESSEGCKTPSYLTLHSSPYYAGNGSNRNQCRRIRDRTYLHYMPRKFRLQGSKKDSHERGVAVSRNSKDVKNPAIDRDSVYNLKRRIASLSPISLTVFQKQVLPAESGDDEKGDAPSFQQSCAACEQHYTNRKAWQAHLKSRNHIQKSAEIPSLDALSLNSSEDSQSINEEDHFNPLQCLFCNAESASLDLNLIHMSHSHSFFIPDAEYLIDIESLLSYLFAIISVFHECLFCGSLKSTKFAVQDHMRGKGHCKVDFEDEEHQLKQFYDFSGDISDEEEGQDLQEEATLVPDEDELHLPSGKTLGQRSRARYFRQKAPARSSSASSSHQKQLTQSDSEALPTETIRSKDQSLVMRAGTSTSMIGIPQIQQRALLAVEQKMAKIEARARNEYEARVERKANQQKRYKVSSMGKKAGGLEKRLG